jgi:predicted nucleic acid-binding protein
VQRRRRIYADTSVLGGAAEPKFAFGSRQFLALAGADRFELVTSDLVIEELLRAPEGIRAGSEAALAHAMRIEITSEAEALAHAYVENGVVGYARYEDALHVALATVAECSHIVSWNFQHIVNDRRIPLFNAVNVLRGYNEIQIVTPYEVLGL